MVTDIQVAEYLNQDLLSQGLFVNHDRANALSTLSPGLSLLGQVGLLKLLEVVEQIVQLQKLPERQSEVHIQALVNLA